MKKIILWMLIIFSINTVSYAEEESIELYAQSAVLMDGESGRILYEKDGENAMANASTTKILTCILALEYGDLNSVVEASAYAASQPAVHLDVITGEQYYMEDLLYALMLESYNDCAVMIAEEIAGSVEGFAELMNEKAKEMGCTDTYFITPNGLDDEDAYSFHHTTASDLALIMRYCIMESPQSEMFLEITQTLSYSFATVDGSRSFYCTNYNSLLQMMSEALTGKTGYTNDAGYCYVGAIESEGRTFIIALLASGWPSNRTYRWEDAAELFDYAMENYFYETIESVTDTSGLDSIQIMEEGGGETESPLQYMPIYVVASDPVEILKREDETVEIFYEYPTQIYSFVEKDTLIGSVRYVFEDEVYKIDGIRTAEDYVEEEKNIWEQFLEFVFPFN